MSDIIERLKASCVGSPAKINWPHRVLHDAIAEIQRLQSELAEAKGRVKVLEGFITFIKEENRRHRSGVIKNNIDLYCDQALEDSL